MSGVIGSVLSVGLTTGILIDVTVREHFIGLGMFSCVLFPYGSVKGGRSEKERMGKAAGHRPVERG